MIAKLGSIPSQSSRPVTSARRPERKRVTRWTKGGFVGLIAGALFLMVEMLLLELFKQADIWTPVRLSASITLGNRAVAIAAPLTTDIVFVGLLMHFILSIWYAVVLGLLIRKLKPGMATLAGAVFGVLLYVFHFYGLVAIYPWVANARGWIVVVAHLVFGMSAGWIYSHLHTRELMREAKAILGH